MQNQGFALMPAFLFLEEEICNVSNISDIGIQYLINSWAHNGKHHMLCFKAHVLFSFTYLYLPTSSIMLNLPIKKIKKNMYI
jgi:hypothetical protein